MIISFISCSVLLEELIWRVGSDNKKNCLTLVGDCTHNDQIKFLLMNFAQVFIFVILKPNPQNHDGDFHGFNFLAKAKTQYCLFHRQSKAWKTCHQKMCTHVKGGGGGGGGRDFYFLEKKLFFAQLNSITGSHRRSSQAIQS